MHIDAFSNDMPRRIWGGLLLSYLYLINLRHLFYIHREWCNVIGINVILKFIRSECVLFFGGFVWSDVRFFLPKLTIDGNYQLNNKSIVSFIACDSNRAVFCLIDLGFKRNKF